MNKKVLRSKLKKKREKQSFSQKLNAENLITDALFTFNEVKVAKNVFVYLSFNKEVGTEKVIGKLMQMGKNVYVPKIYNDVMKAVQFKSPFIKNSFGIVEPENDIEGEDIDLIITPLLGFDGSLNRIGYGKGYYDKYFSDKGKKAFKIGLAFDFQYVKNAYPNENDVPLDVIITDKKIYKR